MQVQDLPAGTSVFNSSFHYKIKCYSKTATLKTLKVRLVVQGQAMEEGEDFYQAFAPVPLVTAGRVMISLAGANQMHLHSCNITQAFISSQVQ